MRWTACMVFSSGAMNSAAYPAKKISTAIRMVTPRRPFMISGPSFFQKITAQKPRSRKKHDIKSCQKRDPGDIESGLLLKERRGGFHGGNQQRRKDRKKQQR